jgi:hypothetical protein
MTGWKYFVINEIFLLQFVDEDLVAATLAVQGFEVRPRALAGAKGRGLGLLCRQRRLGIEYQILVSHVTVVLHVVFLGCGGKMLRFMENFLW